MSQAKIDNRSPFGTFSARPVPAQLIGLIRKLPTGWFGKRLMFALRRLARRNIGEILDTEIFGAKLRMYAEGNVSEKRALYAPQFFDLEEREALKKLAQNEAVFIDIGANIGLYSFSTAQAFKDYKNTRILAIEPHPIISQRLAYNVSLNPDLPIEPMVMGLGDREGKMSLVTPTHNLGESRLLKDDEDQDGEIIEVPVNTLLGFLKAQNVKRVDGMKIDIEGFEEAVLIPFFEKASENLLPKLIVIENNIKKWDTELIVLAKEKGYEVEKVTRMNVMLRR